MDMTAWVKKGTTESVGIIQDFVDPDLTDFIVKLVEQYRELSQACSNQLADEVSSCYPSCQDTVRILLLGPRVFLESGIPVRLCVSQH